MGPFWNLGSLISHLKLRYLNTIIEYFNINKKELLCATNANFFLFREVGYLHSIFVLIELFYNEVCYLYSVFMSICRTTVNHYIVRACIMDCVGNVG
jgi:hypothetical protein